MLENYKYGNKLPVKDDEHGYVILHDVMGKDADVVAAARLSYDGKGKSEDRGLLRFLLRHQHTTPFEMCEMKFEVQMPMFVARQWIRHRTANVNEMSARYTELPDMMFVPEPHTLKAQSATNKQGRGPKTLDGAEMLTRIIHKSNYTSYAHYQTLLDAGVTRELARGVLPVNTYTKKIWKIDLHNLMHFLNLRLDGHAQKEIREYAKVMEGLFQVCFPMTHEAFVDYKRDAYTMSSMELNFMEKLLSLYRRMAEMTPDEAQAELDILDKTIGATMTKRELGEFKRRFNLDAKG